MDLALALKEKIRLDIQDNRFSLASTEVYWTYARVLLLFGVFSYNKSR